ncbi:MAG TPA: aminotransferase class I/II-fold pyridoxal phosphate-dependent enzyme [Acidimicrobiales bacterium]|nr:aminotransferase class I/II-fold pyridoxal phosphate-dependent enzyme [Acidimicrobiales bacterium]
MARVYLSPPDVGDDERTMLLEAFDSNWIAPLGPHVDRFERQLAGHVGAAEAVALSSGTAALHLALILLGVEPGDDVLVPTLTFVATANAAVYVGARPVLVDCAADSWQLDPELVAEELQACRRRGTMPSAVISVDLYGRCADYERLTSICAEFGVPLVEDAAEALGATHHGRAAGRFGQMAVFSFNGNKIITTGGGGALVTDSPELAAHARHLAAQAREPAAHYEHERLGFNYRMSNLLAAVGIAQLRGLDRRVGRRRAINERYRRLLADVPGISFMPTDPDGEPTWWLTCLLIDPDTFGSTRDEVMAALEAEDIEARPTWKPLHLQPVFAGSRVVRGGAAESVFDRGLCLPSGSGLSDEDLARTVDIVRSKAR